MVFLASETSDNLQKVGMKHSNAKISLEEGEVSQNSNRENCMWEGEFQKKGTTVFKWTY